MYRGSSQFFRGFATAAPLWWVAQTGAWCQAAPPIRDIRPRTVVTEKVAYQIGLPELIAPAPVGNVFLHPTGRYVLIVQEAAPLSPNAAPVSKSPVGAAALLLYDARLHKTRTVWKRRAAMGGASVFPIWLPQSDCAVVTTDEAPARLPGSGKTVNMLGTLLFFNFATSLTPRLLTTSPYGIVAVVSPTEPFFVAWDLGENLTRMGSAPRGTLGPVLKTIDFDFKAWSVDGTVIYGREFFRNPSMYDTPPRTEAERQERQNAKPESALQWYKWDGKSPEATKILGPPTESMKAHEATAPLLPLVLRKGTLPVPFPAVEKAQTNLAAAPIAVLHPLFLEAARDLNTAGDPSRVALVTPDTDEAFLLSDLSALLYKSGGALYAIPLTRIKAAEPQEKP